MNCRSWSFVDLHSGHRFVFLCLSWRVMTCVQGLTLNEPGSVPGLGPFRCTLQMGYLRKVHQASFISSIDLVLGFVAPGAAPKPTVPKVNLRLHTSSECPCQSTHAWCELLMLSVWPVLTSMINVAMLLHLQPFLSGAQTPSPLWSFGLRQPMTDLLLESSDRQPLVLHGLATNNNIHMYFVWAYCKYTRATQ